MNVVVPVSALAGLVVPPRAITDGSADPSWVEMPCRGRAYPRVRLPFDAATAERAGRLLRLQRWRRILVDPLILAVYAVNFVLLVSGRAYLGPVARLVVLGVLLGLSWLMIAIERRLSVAQQPWRIGPVAVYLPALDAEVAAEWVRLNPDEVKVAARRPGWRRYSARVYGVWAAVCVAAAVAVYVLNPPFRGWVVIGLAVVTLVLLAAMIPPGFIRFEEPAD